MSNLSTAGWMVHDVGLAASIGGNLFEQTALEPALTEISETSARERITAKARKRYGWINLASHLAFAVPWLVGRRMLSGREVSDRARTLTMVKDVLVGASLFTGVASIVLGRTIDTQRADRERVKPTGGGAPQRSRALERAVDLLCTANLIANLGIVGVTDMLAMEGNRSGRFSVRSRMLP